MLCIVNLLHYVTLLEMKRDLINIKNQNIHSKQVNTHSSFFMKNAILREAPKYGTVYVQMIG